MFVIKDKLMDDNDQAYMSNPDEHSMIHMVNKKEAKQFNTIKEAKSFIREYKWRLAEFNIQRIKDLIIVEV